MLSSGKVAPPLIASLQATRIILAILSRISPSLLLKLFRNQWIVMGLGLSGGDLFTSVWQLPITLFSLLYGYKKHGRFYRRLGLLFTLTQVLMFLDSFAIRKLALKEVLAFQNSVRKSLNTKNSLIDSEAAIAIQHGEHASRLNFVVQGALGAFYKPWNIDHIRNVTYAYPNEIDAAGGPNIRKFMQLDILRRKTGYKNRPILLYVHGGAWIMGDKQQRTMPICYHFASTENWVVLNVNYRLAPKFKLREMVTDIKRAIRWAKENPHIHGGDPNFIAISGGSAGGHLCTLVALTPNWEGFQRGFEHVDTRVQACLPIYPAIGHVRTNAHWKRWFLDAVVGISDRESKRVFQKSLAEWVDPLTILCNMDAEMRKKELPPFFVVQGDKDNVVLPYLVRTFVTELWKDDIVPVGYLEVPQAVHAFDFAFSPKVLYVCWAAGRAMESVYTAWEASKSSAVEVMHEP
ncbi:Alpha/Beta hydrolase protein [Obelidium mucronatum]|nr:Alpha/Beta hydrolase protein [Obelidium mucronatum]